MNIHQPPLALDVGATVFYRGKPHVIRQGSQDFATIVLVDPTTGTLVEAAIVDLSPGEPAQSPAQKDWTAHDRERLAKADRRYEGIKPLLSLPDRTKRDVRARAEAIGVHASTLYRWLLQFETTGKLTSLVRQDRRDKGETGIPESTEKIVADAIETLYLTTQKRSAAQVIREIDRLCAKAGVPAPHPNTVRNRIGCIEASRKTKTREGNKAARDAHSAHKGHFPGADTPLSVVQIDHTPVDIILVDDIHREPIGRPWLTLAINVCSRMVLGFYVSFDPPGNLSTGLCLAHAILAKEPWLAKLGIETPWPCWGVPRTIHADNAKEFRGNMLRNACQEYGIDLEWRPVATPHYGAHIERLLGTLNEEIHAAPGTTFSNPGERGEYDSEAKAAMSLAEFERWFTILCVEAYHQRKHSELGIPPIAKWREGILGTTKTPGIGVPRRITDELRLKLDLMPFVTRTVQPYGIAWDQIEYQHDVLRPWINAKDPQSPKNKRKFLCRRDPRDISTIWFYDPELHGYYAIPYRNTAHPAISIWELREARKRAQQERSSVPVDELRIFEAYDTMRRIEEDAKTLTKKVRRQNQRRRLGLANAQSYLTSPASTPLDAAPRPAPPAADIQPFDDVDDFQGEDA